MNEENKRIAKNTLILYGRMILNIAIGLFTGRVILDALGESDYGVYNVVGGFVGLFAMVSGPVTSSISRFVVYYLGKGDIKQTREVFGTSILVMWVISGIIVVLAEVVGIWFINNKMVLPPDRLFAANWVFQIALLDMVVTLTMSPYFASFVSHEKFDVDAIMATISSLARLGVCFAIMYTSSDKLILYAILLLVISFTQRMVYKAYCRRHFEECNYKLKFHKNHFKGIFSFAGWNTIGSSAAILRSKGGDILLNLFGGPAVNAAAGVCGTVVGVLSSFAGNFMSAASPQIIKSYAGDRSERLNQLLFTIPKLSYFLLFILALPIMLNVDWALDIWLVKVPDYTSEFICLVLIFQLIELLSRPLIDAKNATGNIRNYQIVVGGIILLALPISYVSLKIGAPVYAVYISNIVIAIVALFARLYMLRGDLVNFSSRSFLLNVVGRVFAMSIVAAIPSLLIIPLVGEGLVRVIVTSTIAVISSIVAFLYVGCTKEEREVFLSYIKRIFSKFHNAKNS